MLERTYTMIKPECVAGRHIGDVIARIEKGGYKILGIKMLHMSKQDAGKFYEIHKARPFYGELTEFMSSGPIVAMVLEKENCIADYRQFIGATNPKEAAAGTIRADFGTDIQCNCVHASDSPENAKIEIKFFFSERELVG
ncbi:MAG: nucleoside-diphosphate kinase [Calditrichaeota bacterium]|nr:nucleoside-diphosphate kinase [Calditrichota bacterium]MCB0303537.1 nucleoside-diphosphate kinase [Calditrichota bacterium]MCB9088684.1 nucleoside-diphosphate kinase [Calditrichia bacterium]